MSTIESLHGNNLTADFWLDWNKVVKTYGDNACMLGGFTEHFARDSGQGGWTAELVRMRATHGELVGVAALRTRGVFGARVATQLLSPVYGTDFVVDPQYREDFIRKTLEHVFDRLRCQSLDLTLPSESPSIESLHEESDSLKFRLETAPLKPHHEEHSILPVKGTWEEFRAARGGDFSRHYRKIEKKLDRTGRWVVSRLYIDNSESVGKIETIEGNSWKHEWRKERGVTSDFDLDALLEFRNSKYSDRADLPRLWLLELDGRPIAYAVALVLNRVAILCKTSYDRQYAGLYCGDYVQNAALKDLFDQQNVSRIDFLTPLPYHHRWTSLRSRRVRMIISRPVPILSALVTVSQRSKRLRGTYNALRLRTLHQ
jgi:hypothetical protein